MCRLISKTTRVLGELSENHRIAPGCQLDASDRLKCPRSSMGATREIRKSGGRLTRNAWRASVYWVGVYQTFCRSRLAARSYGPRKLLRHWTFGRLRNSPSVAECEIET